MAIDYDDDCLESAVDFLMDHEDEVLEALLEGETNIGDVDGLNDSFYETNIGDVGMTLVDAAYIIENSDNVEQMDGETIEDTLRATAHYAREQDIWCKVSDIFDEMVSEYDDQDPDPDGEGGRFDNGAFTPADQIAKEVFDEVMSEYLPPTPEAVPLGSAEEKHIIRRWLELGGGAGLWSGYGLGQSYIDSRCGLGYSIPEVKTYVDYDHWAAARLPHLAGKGKSELRKLVEA